MVMKAMPALRAEARCQEVLSRMENVLELFALLEALEKVDFRCYRRWLLSSKD